MYRAKSHYKIRKQGCLSGTADFGPLLVALTTILALVVHDATCVHSGELRQLQTTAYGMLHKITHLAQLAEGRRMIVPTEVSSGLFPEGPDVRIHLLRRLTKNPKDHGEHCSDAASSANDGDKTKMSAAAIETSTSR